MAGRPPIFKSSTELKNKIDQYFEFIKGEIIKKDGIEEVKRFPEPATITGLALWLGFSDRQSLYDYEKKDEFSCIIKRGRLLVENQYEQALHRMSPTGAIFALKNMGWRDKTETDVKLFKVGKDFEEESYE